MITVKKYSNRRLYDTDASKYITLDELAAKVRAGTDVKVVDAKSGTDLTQATLTQLILEGPAAKLLPVPLLRRLLRMPDDAIGEFFSKYVSWSLEVYLTARSGADQVTPYFPFASVPMQATNALLRMFSGGRVPEAPEVPVPGSERSELAELRAELEALKAELRGAAKHDE